MKYTEEVPLSCEGCGKKIGRDEYCTEYSRYTRCGDCPEMESWMRTVGSLLAGIILSAIIICVFALGHRFGTCKSCEACENMASMTNETHGVRSGILPYMVNPVHNWHPANVNHVYHR